MQTRGLSQAAVSGQIGVSKTALNRWLGGKYEGNNAEIEKALEQWLENNAQQTAFLPTVGTEFVLTTTAEEIIAVLEYTHLVGDMAVAYGVPGMGKTVTADYYAAQYPNCWVAQMAPAFSTATSCLKALMSRLMPHECAEGRGTDAVLGMLCQHLKGTNGLLIIDEAQHLSLPALENLRYLHDAAGVGLVLMGNPTVYARLTGRCSAEFAQLFSRIGRRCKLGKALHADTDAIAKAWGVNDQAALKFLRSIGDGHGTLREVCKNLRLAGMAASGEGEALGLKHLKAAHSERGGAARARKKWLALRCTCPQACPNCL